jgi:hypothetical protein
MKDRLRRGHRSKAGLRGGRWFNLLGDIISIMPDLNLKALSPQESPAR